jgi:hypothetical protein
MKRAMKFRRKRPERKKIVPALALKGSGIGHSLSMAIGRKIKDEKL